ncbi:GTP cyclohydrolase I FolE [Caldanaerobius polysaccharolyticus]|uniref:GTP cyclohydrolase I FolE n=1 Tax=Caldanaerobius polysaccharolyticus TaxID=44256 RepID=UPI00047B5990|nr:GTP cyclohydrolase I FolE [Caldanaerobius polysaccharolyticus]
MNEEKIKEAIRVILEEIGEDPDREGLKDTPDRVYRMYKEIFSGIGADPKEVLTAVFREEHNELVIVKDIRFYSMCEHHMVPFFGRAHVGYLPDGKIIGLSKIARLVDVVSKRLQLQERMTKMIADSLEQRLKPKGVIVMLEAEHLCMSMRGVKRPGSTTVTVATRGIFNTDENMRKRFFELVK